MASVGFDEEEAKQKDIQVKVGKFAFSANGKAIALGEDQGFIKLVFSKDTGALLGAQMVGAEVTELIHSMVLAINLEANRRRFVPYDISASDFVRDVARECTWGLWSSNFILS